jgi:hypothetical protein
MFTKRLAAAFGAMVMLSVSMAQASVITHYDIDFSSPTHTAGSAPTVGGGSDTPSSIVFGQPTVEDSFGALAGQSLVFNTHGNTTPCCYYDQISLDLGLGYDNYQISFDLSSESYVNSGSNNNFAFLLDTPEVRSLNFKNNSEIGVFNPSGDQGNIGSFFDGSLYHVLIDVDLNSNMWDVSLNGVSLYSGLFNSDSGDIDSLRFSYGTTYAGVASTSFDSVGVDNILVTSQVPEPASLALIGVGLLSLFGVKRRYS